MKINLLFPETAGEKPPFSALSDDLRSDLELNSILEYMSGGGKIIFDACEDALLRPLRSAEVIKYRQEALRDTLDNPEEVRQLYAIAAGTDQFMKYRPSASDMTGSFADAVVLIRMYVKLLQDLRALADQKLPKFKSEAFRSLLEMLRCELSDSFFAEVQDQLEEVKDTNNLLISARLGSNLQLEDYRLRRKEKGFWLHWKMAQSHTVDPEKNPAGIGDLFKRRERAIIEATNVLAQSTRFLETFFTSLRQELAFYVGCLNLSDKMNVLGLPVCEPALMPADSGERAWHNLYDISLALTRNAAVVGNDLEAAGKRLFIITGANQGGKSTFLRSLGQAQLMAQCGMPVGAETFKAPIRSCVFTHFKKEEDIMMESGKLDEELRRMRQIADYLKPGALVLFNESFAATNEREGSEICRQITKALVERGIEIFSVTHLFTFASAFLGDPGTQFLLAQRREDSARTYKIIPGAPKETAYGEDLYSKIFINR
jgi:DNA mismatch repair ATPase MutS